MAEEVTKLCPECLKPLEHRQHKIFHNWVCPVGHGTLYPKGELEKIVQAITGLGDLEVTLWNDKDRFSVIQSSLIAPENSSPMIEIRDKDVMEIMVYGDTQTHSLWLHTGEEEKLVEHIERAANADSVSTYLGLAAREAVELFDDDTPVKDAAGHTVVALKLLGDRVLRALPFISF